MTQLPKNYISVRKNNEDFLIENREDDKNLRFWINYFPGWEQDTFSVFDKFLTADKVFIDIGGWIGTTAMYGSRKSKHVYSVEADKYALNDMNLNLKLNCKDNYTLVNKAIYHTNNIDIKFGKNKFLGNSQMNDSTSQIYGDNETSDQFEIVKTITLQTLLNEYNINPCDISLIKVDIEGGEEYILRDLYDLHTRYNVPLYVSFHYTWWKDQNLDRFKFLTASQKQSICANPFTSLVFSNSK